MKKSSLATIIACGSALACSVDVHAATIAYDFTGTAGTQPAGWTSATLVNTVGSGSPNTISSWALNGGGSYSTSGTIRNNGEFMAQSAFEIDDRSAGTNFSISTQFTLGSVTVAGFDSWNVNQTVRFLSSTATSIEGSSALSQYAVSLTRDNGGAHTMVLTRKTSGNAALAVSTVNLQSGALINLFNGSTYTLNISGTYVGASLQIDFGLTSGATTRTGTYTDSSPLAGDYFGYRNRFRNFSGANTLTTSIEADNFNITYTAVPEPSAWFLASVVLGVICLRRRGSGILR